MKFTVGSVAIVATLLLSVTSSSARTAASTSVLPARAAVPLQADLSPGQVFVRHASSQAGLPVDNVLMWALGASLVAIQLRRRHKTSRAPLLRS